MTETQVLLPGFGLAGFRSFGDELRMLGPLSKITLLAGQNNAGKSNVLRFASRFLAQTPPTEDPLDTPRLPNGAVYDGPIRLAVARRVTDADVAAVLPRSGRNAAERTGLTRLLDSAPMRSGAASTLRNDAGTIRRSSEALVWFVYSLQPGRSSRQWALDDEWLAAIVADMDSTGDVQRLTQLAHAVGSTVHGVPERNLPQILNGFSPLAALPAVKTVDAFRQIRAGDAADDFTPTGAHLVSALALLERPDEHNQPDKLKFEAINRFMQTVLGDSTARLQVGGQPEKLLVERQGIVLPLDSLGTGVHQVVMLAAVSTLFDRTLLCVEEPEVHLHPLLQRKLIDYLGRQTTNQYLIATHSAHMLDHSAGNAVYHLQPGPDGTRVDRADTSEQLADICFDLGYRPSDLLQANAVIWVEGPSDRVYLTRWLRAVDGDLEEHVHYSVMFYGGRLLNHLTTLDDALAEDLIRLRRLNRHLAILIDSDKEAAGRRINATKQRVVGEFKQHRDDGLAWVTAGRTIENYVPAELLNAAVKAVHRNAKPAYGGGRWELPLPSDGQVRYDKVRIAHEVCDHWDDDGPMLHGLREDLERMAHFVRHANGLNDSRPPSPSP